MALIKCSECGKEISDKAKKCPHCGFKINDITDKNNNVFYKKINIILFILWGMYFLLEMHWQYTYRNDIMNFYSIMYLFEQIFLSLFLCFSILYFIKEKSNFKKMGFVFLIGYCLLNTIRNLSYYWTDISILMQEGKIISFFEIIEYISPIFPLIILGIIGLKIGNDENGINKM